MSRNFSIFFLNAKKTTSSFIRFAGVIERSIHLTRAKLPFLFSRALRFTQSLSNFPQSCLIPLHKPGYKLVHRMTLENDCGKCFIKVKNNSTTYNCLYIYFNYSSFQQLQLWILNWLFSGQFVLSLTISNHNDDNVT